MRIPVGLEEPLAITWPPHLWPILCAAWQRFLVCTYQCQLKSPEGSHPSSLFISWLLSQVDMAHEGHSQHSGLFWALRPVLPWIFLVACVGSHPLQTRSWGHPGLAAKVSTGQLQPAGEHSLSALTPRNPTYIFLVRGFLVKEGGQTGLVMTAGFNSPESGYQIRLLGSNPKSILWCSVTLSKSDNLGRVLGMVVPICNPST